MRVGYAGSNTNGHRVHHGRLHTDDILNMNVGGKKYTVGTQQIGGWTGAAGDWGFMLVDMFRVRRTDLLADPRSKLADWFRPGTTRLIPADRAGNFFLDRDPKCFRHILGFLRLKKERSAASLALPSGPDELAKLVAECEALNLVELKEMAVEMLQKYVRTEEQHHVTSYAQTALRDYEAWQFEQEQDLSPKGRTAKEQQRDNSSEQNSAYDEWEK